MKFKLKLFIDSRVNVSATKYTFKMLLELFLGINYSIKVIEYNNKDSINQLQMNEKECTIFYGYPDLYNHKFSFIILASNFWDEKSYLQKNHLPDLPLPKYYSEELIELIDAEDLPIIYLGEEEKSSKKPYIQLKSGQIKTNIDFIASSFFLLSRYEEIVNTKYDDYGNFIAEESIAFKEGFLLRPLVNEYLEVIWFWLKQISPGLQRKERRFHLRLTHDIDYLKFWTKQRRIKYLELLLRRRDWKTFAKYLWRNILWLFKKPKDSFDFILEICEKYRIVSYFYFLIDGTNALDRGFDPHTSEVKELIQKLEQAGHRVGLHPSYSSFRDEQQLRHEKDIFEKYVTNKNYGVRKHYLRIRVPESFRLLEKMAFKHDSSLGYLTHDGFRASVCYPYKLFDIKENRELDLWEYPLIAMDRSLSSALFRNLSYPEVKKELMDRIDKVAFFNGCFVLLIHNTQLEEVEFLWRPLLKKIIKYCKKKTEEL